MENALGLVMTGGGARGAYQAGVLKRIGEIPLVQRTGNPFPIIGGSSAGSVNGCALLWAVMNSPSQRRCCRTFGLR